TNTGERYQFRLDANYNRNTTLTSEYTSSGVISNTRREEYELMPTWSYMVTEANKIQLSGFAKKAIYENDNYIGYEYGQVSGEWSYSFTEALSIFGALNATNYESDEQWDERTFQFIGNGPIQVEQGYRTLTESGGVQAGASYQYSEQLEFFGLVGAKKNWTNYDLYDPSGMCSQTAGNPSWVQRGVCDLADQEQSEISQNSTLRATWAAERNTLRLEYSIGSEPSSRGYLLDSNEVNFNWSYQIAKKGRVYTDLLWGKNENIDNFTSAATSRVSDQEYVTAKFGYDHKIFADWTLSAQYTYRKREFVNAEDATGNALRFGVMYKPVKKVW
ncbi:MAG: hypothetical protein GY814_20445, partial [Gammaproteobacteria bacterium]|nr:hypothetical protein [Gammaproteobacteria bacterium]